MPEDVGEVEGVPDLLTVVLAEGVLVMVGETVGAGVRERDLVALGETVAVGDAGATATTTLTP